MNVAHTFTVAAPAESVWTLFTDVVRWPEWTPSVVRVEIVGADRAVQRRPQLAVGTEVRINQPGMPELTWVVTELTAGRSWTWESRSPGVTTTATHEIETIDSAACRVRQVIAHRGPLAWPIGLLSRSKTRRFLDQEATGLRQRAETAWNADAAAT
jgi:Polyketide cyclase / dehydrase and lipid transport